MRDGVSYFRYTGKSVQGEIEDSDGNVIPNIIDSAQVYGYTFHSRKYTEVPNDAVAYMGRVMNWETEKRVRKPCYIVDKLRGNSHFEEKAEDKGATEAA